MQKRIYSVDIAKGIAIILVIVGHKIPCDRGGIREIIYSFHMPLFFILSAYTSRYSENLNEMKQRALHICKKLGVPLLLIWLVYLIVSCLSRIEQYESVVEFLRQKLLQLFYASGVTNSQLVILGGGNIEALGIPWFFMTLIVSKIIYDAIQMSFGKYLCLLIVAVLSCLGGWTGQYYHFPLGLDTSLAVLLFLWIGHQMKNFDLSFSVKKLLFSVVSWVSLWLITNKYGDWGLEIAGRSYPLFPLCFIEALAGTLVIVIISDFISKSKNRFITQLMLWGMCSLNILMIHCVDFLWENCYSVSDNLLINTVLCILVDLSLFYLYRLIAVPCFRGGKELIAKVVRQIS